MQYSGNASCPLLPLLSCLHACMRAGCTSCLAGMRLHVATNEHQPHTQPHAQPHTSPTADLWSAPRLMHMTFDGTTVRPSSANRGSSWDRPRAMMATCRAGGVGGSGGQAGR